jgi:hypothetical protein
VLILADSWKAFVPLTRKAPISKEHISQNQTMKVNESRIQLSSSMVYTLLHSSNGSDRRCKHFVARATQLSNICTWSSSDKAPRPTCIYDKQTTEIRSSRISDDLSDGRHFALLSFLRSVREGYKTPSTHQRMTYTKPANAYVATWHA